MVVFNDEFIKKIKKNIRRITAVQFGIILILFFTPFLTVSCSGAMNVELTGFDMAFGSTVPEKDPFSGRVENRKINGDWKMIVVLVSALSGLFLSFYRQMIEKKRKQYIAFFGASGFVFLLFSKFYVEYQINKGGEGMVQAYWEFGFWLSLVLFLGVMVSSYLSLNAKKDEDGN